MVLDDNVNSDERARLIRRRVLDERGRVIRWPSKQLERSAVLQYLLAQFVPNTGYTEAQVNAILNEWHTFQDWALLRRALVDGRLISRDPAGGEYRVAETKSA